MSDSATPQTAAHQALPSLGFSRQEHWSGLPFPSPMHETESEVAQSCPTLHDPMDCSLPGSSIHGIVQARVLEWVAIAFSDRPCRYPHESNELGARLGLVCPLRGFGSQSQCLQIPLFPDNLHLPRIQMITFAISPVLSCNSQSYVHPIFTFNTHRGRYQRWTLCHMHRV